MDRKTFDQYCASLHASENVIQWGDASVWKIGGKIFAICSNWGEGAGNISFKCSDLAYQVLTDMHDIIPAPYLARAKWVQLAAPDALSDDEVRAHIDAAYDIIARKLTRAKRAELGIVVT
ncbi:hypothetical protein BFP76_04170 [Amylibacter kogurei]|uniref:MmcQ/YjbR family DNA-binding protein n=1 Tax=Paramylibacter kogurei TaxID=1889778 RepID=A0A2G5K5W1_9RHOB|nr:MmcQ/YjbR family DNA-binding protein [Amylibacter kogurei]PIB24412.1 hypothetical protein BFP76_04170 [Amylibacter kogurei]